MGQKQGALLLTPKGPCPGSSHSALFWTIPLVTPFLHTLLWLRGKFLSSGLRLGIVAGSIALFGYVLLLAGFLGEAQEAEAWEYGAKALLPAALIASAVKVLRPMRPVEFESSTGNSICIYVIIILYGGQATVPPLHGRVYRTSRNEAHAVGSLRAIQAGEEYYVSRFHRGYTPSLFALCPPESGGEGAPRASGLVDSVLARGRKCGYLFAYFPGKADGDGRIKSYTVTAQPVEPCETGIENFFMDNSGVIRSTKENRAATASHPPDQFASSYK